MTWGVAKWGSGFWGGDPLPTAQNLSFELAALDAQGQAHGWEVTVESAEIGYRAFASTDYLTTWNAAESFDNAWRYPYCVHYASDPTNIVSILNGATLAQLLLLSNALRDAFNAHCGTASAVHLSADTANFVYEYATDLPSLLQLLNALKAAFNAHCLVPAIAHQRIDVLNAISTPAATTLVSASTLAGALKTALNNHVLLLGYGAYNEQALFTFLPENIDNRRFTDAYFVESFEKFWSIPDILGANQYLQVSTDAAAPGSPLDAILTFIASSEGVHPITLSAGVHATWPSNHLFFLSSLINLAVQQRFDPADNFEVSWLQPGSIPDYTNDRFTALFWNPSKLVWEFTDVRLEKKLDNFETGWKNNEVGLAKYWNGTSWRFLSSHLKAGGFGPDYVFGKYAETEPHVTLYSALANYAPRLYLKVTSAFLGPAIVTVQFNDAFNAAKTCYFRITATTLTVDSTLTEVALTAEETAPLHPFYAIFTGIKQVTAISIAYTQEEQGAIELAGPQYLVESFELGWTTTLDLLGL